MGTSIMNNEKIYHMAFADLYPFYIAKAERKGRTKEEVNQIIYWLTGYNDDSLTDVTNRRFDVQSFFEFAPHFNENAVLITGVICGVRIETIQEPLMQKIRYLDKLIDELAKGKSLDKIFRTNNLK